MDCTICVVVPVYNRAATILSTLDSVANQSLRPAQLIVIDDGSTDSTTAKVATWLRNHRSTINGRTLWQANSGVAAARNRGLIVADPSEFVAFLDSDDRWPADFLERAATAMVASPGAIAATCDREVNTALGAEPEFHNLATLAASPITWMLSHGAGVLSATLLRTAPILRRGGFDVTLKTGEDAALLMPLALEGTWLHLPGLPVLFDRSLSNRADVEGNLSHKFRDNHRRWAGIYENFICREGGAAVVRSVHYRPLLAKAWYRAGKELTRAGSLDEARDCFRRALTWQRWNAKIWYRLVRAYSVRSAIEGADVLGDGEPETVSLPFARQSRLAAPSVPYRRAA